MDHPASDLQSSAQLIFKSPHPSVNIPATSFFDYVVQQNAPYPEDHPACIDGLTGAVLTRRELTGNALSLGSALRSMHRVGMLPLLRGSTVMVLTPLTPLAVTLLFAVGAAGVRAYLGDCHDLEGELSRTFLISGASHVLVHPTYLARIVGMLNRVGISRSEAKRRVVVLSDRVNLATDMSAEGWLNIEDLPNDAIMDSIPERFDGAQAHDTALLYTTYGQCGPVKLAEITHYNVNSVMAQLSSTWHYYKHGRDIVLGTMPLDGVFGCMGLILWTFFSGLPLVILPKFDPNVWLSCIPKYQITATILPSPLLAFLSRHPLVDKYDLSSLKLIAIGAAPFDAAALARTRTRLAKRNCRPLFIETYGMTETCLAVAWRELPEDGVVSAGVGHLVPNMEGRVMDQQGRDVGPGVTGELLVKGPIVMKGYCNDPDATVQAFTDDGWFKTGDLVSRDCTGLLRIHGRKKEFIKYNAWQVSPSELEGLLCSHPAVCDAGVVGVYCPKRCTELPRAYVVLDGSHPTDMLHQPQLTRGLNSWLATRVADYKLLHGGAIPVTSLPRDVHGRIDRGGLRRVVEKELSTARL